MFPNLFSRRYGLIPTPDGLVFDAVPQRVRVGLCHIVDYLLLSDRTINYRIVYRACCAALRVPREPAVASEYQAELAVHKLIMECHWWHFYDLCEALSTYPASPDSKRDLAKNINELLAEERMGFELRQGRLERLSSSFVDSEIQEARFLLKEAEFKGADAHFEKAVRAISERPNPDVENCIKDAVAAVESVGRVLAGDLKAVLSDILKDMSKKGTIPKALEQAIQKLYAYRGDEPGVAHGLVDDSAVTIDEAQLVLAMSAAIMVYLVNKHKNA